MPESGCKSNLAEILADHGVQFMIAGNMGRGRKTNCCRWYRSYVRFYGNIGDAVARDIRGFNGDDRICLHHEHHHCHGHDCDH